MSGGLGASDDYERLLADRKRLSATSQDDLRLAARIGSSLLEEREALSTQLDAAETAKHELLDRLAATVRENAQLEKRLQRAVDDLEASETSNRNLLATLEDDRRTIARISFEQARDAGSDGKLKALAREREDLRQELESERKRSSAADAKARRATDKLAASEAKLERLRADADGQRQRGAERDQETLSKAKALMTLAANAPRSPKLGEPEEEFPEVLALVQNLVVENDKLRDEAVELNDLLSAAREEQSGMRSEIESRQAFLPEEDSNANATLLSETLMSDSGSERVLSPAFGDSSNATTATSWAPSTSYTNKRLSTFSTSSISESGVSQQSHMPYHLPDGGLSRRRGSLRRISTGPRMHNRRAQSIDVGALSSENEGDLPIFPRPIRTQGSRPPSRQDFRASTPMQTPLQPLHDAMEQEADDPHEVSPRELCFAPQAGPSLSSAMRNRILSLSRPESADACTQTDEPISAGLLPAFSLLGSRDPPEQSLSDSSDVLQETRTAALLVLMEHVTRLLGRIKAADIASLESRFKKQRLTGDVGHLSKATVKEILGEIEGLRDHFRKVLEAESRARPPTSEHDSLISKRDFVNLVKLLRDTFLELARLRGLVNRIQLEPHLASRLADLDKESTSPLDAVPHASNGLLAPLTRLFSPAPSPLLPPPRPVPARQEATAAIAPTLVNVEFGKAGAIRRAVSIAPQADGGLGGNARGASRGLNAIFAGGGLRQSAMGPSRSRAAGSSKEDGPALPAPGRLLERQLRPRGLSDSSIRTGFEGNTVNPANRVLTPAALALSSQGGAAEGANAPAANSREAVMAALSARVNSFKTEPAVTPKLAPINTKAQLPSEPVGINSPTVSDESDSVPKGESFATSLGRSLLWNGISAWAAKAAFVAPTAEERGVPSLKRRGDI